MSGPPTLETPHTLARFTPACSVLDTARVAGAAGGLVFQNTRAGESARAGKTRCSAAATCSCRMEGLRASAPRGPTRLCLSCPITDPAPHHRILQLCSASFWTTPGICLPGGLYTGCSLCICSPRDQWGHLPISSKSLPKCHYLSETFLDSR